MKKTALLALAIAMPVAGLMVPAANADDGVMVERTVVQREGYRDGYYDGLRYVPRRDYVRVKKTRCWTEHHRRVCRTTWVREPVRHHYR